MSEKKTSEITGEISACTVKYQWVINYDCLFNKNVGDALKSPIFETLHIDENHEWQLELYPKGLDNCQNIFIIYLHQLGPIKSSATVLVSYKIFNNEGEKLGEVARRNAYLYDKAAYVGQGFQRLSKFLNQAEKNNKEDDGKLTIVCEIILEENEEQADCSKHRNLKVDLEQLIDNKEFSDVKFTFGNKELRAHKSILSGRSPVFAAMFRNEIKEKHETEVEIVDVRHEVFLAMLRYIYTEEVINDIEEIASELLAAADMYSLEGLKLMCEKSLCSNLNAENALENLLLADRHGAQSLKIKCIELIVTKAADIVDKPEFRQLPSNILCDVCSAVLTDKKES